MSYYLGMSQIYLTETRNRMETTLLFRGVPDDDDEEEDDEEEPEDEEGEEDDEDGYSE